jgi:hypothetical protein
MGPGIFRVLRTMYKKRLFLFCILFLAISLNASVLTAGKAKLSWNRPTANTDGTRLTDLAGYKIYYGTSPGCYSEMIDVGKATKRTIADLTDGLTYYFVATAYNKSGYESGFSNEVSKTIPQRYSVSPLSVNLGSVKVGWSSSPGTVTIKNASNADLIINSITISGANQSEFIQTGSCSAVPAGSSCPISVTFSPVAPFGKKDAIMTISTGDIENTEVDVKLRGQTPPPGIYVSPQSLNFGSLSVGSESALEMVTIRNKGKSDLAVNAIALEGANAGEFSETNNCTLVTQGSSCAINVTFGPTSAGVRTATMGISSNDPKKPFIDVKLVGSGSSP